MRLTLRTLLAYLDDILEPAQAKELGRKIAESDVASALVDRIREVMRRRRLTAPDVNGPAAGLDPNTVAEYLDNTLGPESVADVEKVCLDSDVHLAEVAACHQILTLVVGEPVDIGPVFREHMYALGPIGRKEAAALKAGDDAQHEVSAAPEPESAAGGQATAQRQAAAPQDATEPISATIPEYLKPRPFLRRAFPYIVVSVIAGVWLGLILLDPLIFPGISGDSPPGGDEVASRDGSGVVSPEPEQPPQTEPAVAEPPDETAKEAGPDMNVALVPPSPESVSPDAKPKPAEKPQPEGPEQPQVAVGDRPEMADPGEAAPAEMGQAEEPAAEAPEIAYDSNTGILLRYDTEANDWVVMPRPALVRPDVWIASPEPFEAVLDVGDRLCRVSLLAGTVVRSMKPKADMPFGFEINRGRVILESQGEENGEEGTGMVLAVAAAGESWRVELMPGRTRCGIEIVPRQPDRLEQKFGRNSYTGGLYVAGGSVRFTDGSGRVRDVAVGRPVSLAPEDRATAAGAESPVLNALPPELPAWLETEQKRATVTFRRYANLFEREFETDQQPTSFILPAMVKDPRPQIAEMAVKCLALTDNYAPLVQALAQAEHEEARLAAIDGLRVWLPASPENGKLLQEELQRTFNADDAAAVYRLLWGFNETDARNELASHQLVEWLEHDHIAVRELAFYHVHLLTGYRFDYRASLPAAQRSAAVARWLTHLEKVGALLPE